MGHKLQLPGQDSEDRKTPVLGALPPLDHEMENLGAVIMDTLEKFDYLAILCDLFGMVK